MSWLQDISLGDLDDHQRLEATCPKCRFSWTQSVEQMQQAMERTDLFLDEVADRLRCQRGGCGHAGMRLALLHNGSSSGFVAGLP